MANTATDTADVVAHLRARIGVPVNHAATILGAHRATVYRLIERGELTAYHLGRHTRVTTASLLAYTAAGEPVAPPSGSAP